MTMRKLFRMQHEPCHGTCYTPDKVMRLAEVSDADRERILAMIGEVHDAICGDARFGLGIDLDEETGRMVGHVQHPAGVDHAGGAGLMQCVERLCSLAAKIIAAVPPRTDLSVCDHGASGDLKAFWLRWSAAPPASA